MTAPKIIGQLPPVRASLGEIEALEKLIKKSLFEHIYRPILAALSEPKATVMNASPSAVTRALRSGTIRYQGMAFIGRFSAEIGRELRELGAVYDKGMRSYLIARHMLPASIQRAIEQSEVRFQKKIARLETVLAKIIPEKITETIGSAKIFEKLLDKTDRDIFESLRKITIEPKLSKEAKDRIALDWQDNLDLYIKGFTASEIKQLRKAVMKSTLAGNRYETLIDSIQKRYGVSERKAHFWARQETNLLVTKMKEIRYEQAGIKWYRWKCVAGSPAHPVRPSHKALDGKVFRYDQPPITTGPGQPVRRNNPGQDYNCRCVSIPLLVQDV